MRKTVKHIVRFGKSRYHQHMEMCAWCRLIIGEGKWLDGTPKTWAGINVNWCVDSMFGTTTFSFKDPKHLTMFLLRWS